MLYQMEKLFDEQIRPALASHGGSIDIVDIDNGILYIKFKGGCQGCSSASATLLAAQIQLLVLIGLMLAQTITALITTRTISPVSA